jgi:hypothetical protein
LGTAGVETLAKTQNGSDIAEARIALAEILLASHELNAAQNNAQEAVQYLEAVNHNEAAWRAWVTLARVHSRLDKPNLAAEDRRNAAFRLDKLRGQWDPQDFNTYLKRPDLQHLHRDIEK